MIHRNKFSDERLDLVCTYCGINVPDTRDHVPSRILLDDPFPENLPVVPCCSSCNQSFSLDEEYFACLLECVICGTTEVDKLQRDKVKRILSRKESLRQRIEGDKFEENGQIQFRVDVKRFENVALKLAKGHAKFEYSEIIFEEPTHFSLKPLHTMSAEEQQAFFTLETITKFPEVGSRAFISIVEGEPTHHWIEVQENIYSYSTQGDAATVIKILLWNYLAIEVIWE
jgi:hypothetical protein